MTRSIKTLLSLCAVAAFPCCGGGTPPAGQGRTPPQVAAQPGTQAPPTAQPVATPSSGTTGSVSTPAAQPTAGAGAGAGSGASGAAGASGATGATAGSSDAKPLDPDAFAYAYEKIIGPDVGEGGEGPTTLVLLTTDPHACDTGTLVLRANQPILSSQQVVFFPTHKETASPFALSTLAPVSPGLCALFGGDPANAHGVSGTLLGRNSLATGSQYTYDLAIAGTKATLAQVPGLPGPSIVTRYCKFEDGPQATVPCK